MRTIARRGSSKCSFRIPDRLKASLEEAARRTNKGKNWILNRALEEYLARHAGTHLREEARRQSLPASRKRWKDEGIWENAAAETWNE